MNDSFTLQNKSLYENLQKIDFYPRNLVRQVNALKKKRAKKTLAFQVLQEVLFYLLITNKKKEFLDLFTNFIASDLGKFSKADWNIKDMVYVYIIFYSELEKSDEFLYFIHENGFIQSRLEGSLLNHYLKSIQKEIMSCTSSKYCPIDTIISRSLAISFESLFIGHIKEKRFFSNNTKFFRISKKYQELYLYLVEHYYEDKASLTEHLAQFSVL